MCISAGWKSRRYMHPLPPVRFYRAVRHVKVYVYTRARCANSSKSRVCIYTVCRFCLSRGQGQTAARRRKRGSSRSFRDHGSYGTTERFHFARLFFH